LAQIYLSSLNDKLTPKAIRNALKDFKKQAPGTSEDKKVQVLAHAYEQAMKRINEQMPGLKELANQVLSWITCAKRQLTTTELQHALAVEVGESEFDEQNLPQIEDMVSVCAGLVTVDEQSGIIRLVHYTTQEYFEQTQKSWFPDAETDIARTCITYLSFDTFEGFSPMDEDFEARLRLNMFYEYAANYWRYHARAGSTEVGRFTADFLKSESNISASAQAIFAASPHVEGYKFHFADFPLARLRLSNVLKEDDHVGDKEYLIWMVGQLARLASELAVIHAKYVERFGSDAMALGSGELSQQQHQSKTIHYHHEFTPKNLLLSKNPKELTGLQRNFGKIRFSGFGLESRPKRDERLQKTPKMIGTTGTRRYAMPEVGKDWELRIDWRKSDIWQFGRVTLEILRWLIYGPQEKENSSERRLG
jgi:hypothetical protein